MMLAVHHLQQTLDSCTYLGLNKPTNTFTHMQMEDAWMQRGAKFTISQVALLGSLFEQPNNDWSPICLSICLQVLLVVGMCRLFDSTCLVGGQLFAASR